VPDWLLAVRAVAPIACVACLGGRIGDLFPEAAVAVVTVVGGLGLILYMLLVGITIDPEPDARTRRRDRAADGPTVGAMVLLLVMGAAGFEPATSRV